MPAPQNDHYDPLPGFLSLPGFLYRKLGPSGRIAAKVGGGIFLATVIAATIVLAPRIAESNRERKADERREAQVTLAARIEQLREEQRPHRGSAEAGASRVAVLAELEAAVLTDARARKLHGPAPSRVQCEPLDGANPDAARVAYDCIAVTSDLPSVAGLPGGVVGHPFRAVADYSTGRFTWCKVSGRPGEGSLTSGGLVRIPRACSR